MVTLHIKPTAPHHTTVLIASVKKNSTTRSFTHVISVRSTRNLAKDGTLANSGRFTLLLTKPLNGGMVRESLLYDFRIIFNATLYEMIRKFQFSTYF